MQNSNLTYVAAQTWSYTELQNNASKSMSWNDCLFLAFGTGNYGNVAESIVVPAAYFAATSASNRIILTWNNSTIQIYKGSDTIISITTSSLSNEQTLRVYGLIHK